MCSLVYLNLKKRAWSPGPALTIIDHNVSVSLRTSSSFHSANLFNVQKKFICYASVWLRGFTYDIEDIIPAFILAAALPELIRAQLSSPRWEITAVCFSYLSAASSSCLLFFPTVNRIIPQKQNLNARATAYGDLRGSITWHSAKDK